ncbi:hypothetical protein DFA_01644 [Cavenderia fasciculata]|uniref:Ankyrin repeat-containing protein n=1 Tax=Cavenderia fasciculata TaxID=261658 RepID=F4PTZ0_CACFS|nr:uncharacterized protein DFA_01644 [Cavenderia fasciculata]EGG21758.1 hypothetical protein DFA_01644 [Cavenderia fasciculata]|eukprot:XP_004359608.1 hypothetical protein DFA_01644 [Cavenderia fasciculata]
MDNDLFFITFRNVYLFKCIFNQIPQIHKTLGKKISYGFKDVLFEWASKNGYDRLVIEKFRLYPQSFVDQMKYKPKNTAIVDTILRNKYFVLDDYKKVLGIAMEIYCDVKLLNRLAYNHQWYREDACKLIEAIEYTKSQLAVKMRQEEEIIFLYSNEIVIATIQSNNLQAVQYLLEKLSYAFKYPYNLYPQSIVQCATEQPSTQRDSTLILEYLVKKYKDQIDSSLFKFDWIAMHGNYKVIKILLDNGIEIAQEQITPKIVEIACHDGKYDYVVYLLDKFKGICLSSSLVLTMAAKSSNLTLLKYLYENINIDCGPLEVMLPEFIKYDGKDKLYYISYPDPTKTYFYQRYKDDINNHDHDHDHEYQLKKYQKMIDYLNSIYTKESIQFFGDQMNQCTTTIYYSNAMQMHKMFGKSSWISKIIYNFPELE